MLGILELHAKVAAVAKQTLELRQVVWGGYDKNLPNVRQHKHGDGIVYHWLVEDRDKLLADALCDWVKPCTRTTG